MKRVGADMFKARLIHFGVKHALKRELLDISLLAL